MLADINGFVEDAAKNNYKLSTAIDEIAKNNAIWLYHSNFMLIVRRQYIFSARIANYH
jgi:hypothetical protein